MISDFFIRGRTPLSILMVAFLVGCLVFKRDFWVTLPFLVVPIVVVWLSWLFSTLFLGGALNRLGIYPRRFAGLLGIILAPLLHDHHQEDEAQHLLGNTLAFATFGGFIVMLRSIEDFLVLTAVVALGSGLFTWLYGQSGSHHIGASGILYGYLGFLLLRGFYEHQIGSTLLSMLVLAFCSPSLLGIFPQDRGISWEMHFGGFVSGLITAIYLSPIKANLTSLPSTALQWLERV